MSLVKFVGDQENWQWVTSEDWIGDGGAPRNRFNVIFPQGTPKRRIVALRVGVFGLDEEGAEIPNGDPAVVTLYRKQDNQSLPWPDNLHTWRVLLRAFETETIAWTLLDKWNNNDQIQFNVETGLSARVIVSILVETVKC